MKTLILYTSKYGCTKDCANYLKSKLGQQTDIASLDYFQTTDLQHYDWIILGGSIYIGKIQKPGYLSAVPPLNNQTIISKIIFPPSYSGTHPKQ